MKKTLLLVAMAWLFREARETGFLPWEKVILVAIWPLALMTWIVGTSWHIPLAPITHLAVLSLGLRRVLAGATAPAAFRDYKDA